MYRLADNRSERGEHLRGAATSADIRKVSRKSCVDSGKNRDYGRQQSDGNFVCAEGPGNCKRKQEDSKQKDIRRK